MIKFFKGFDREHFVYRVLPHLMLELLRKYFRLEVEGLENVPRRGAAVITPNHSGFAGLDALLLAHILYRDVKRIPRILTHHFWFLTKATAAPAQKMGFVDATLENGISALEKNNLMVIFPEGEEGNFKPTTERYQLQEFKRGFIRMAIQTQSPIVPTLIIGAEESNINISKLRFGRILKNMVLPLPLNVVPLPVKWKIKFLPPIYLPYKPEQMKDRELMHEIADEIRELMQEALSDELLKR